MDAASTKRAALLWTPRGHSSLMYILHAWICGSLNRLIIHSSLKNVTWHEYSLCVRKITPMTNDEWWMTTGTLTVLRPAAAPVIEPSDWLGSVWAFSGRVHCVTALMSAMLLLLRRCLASVVKYSYLGLRTRCCCLRFLVHQSSVSTWIILCSTPWNFWPPPFSLPFFTSGLRSSNTAHAEGCDSE